MPSTIERPSGPPALPPRPYRLRLAESAPATLGPRVLACVAHGDAQPDDGDPRRIQVDLPPLRGPGVEIWESADDVRFGVDDGIGYAANDDCLFAQLHLPESALAPMDAAMTDAYARLESLLQRLGYGHWLRTWNFIAHINHGEADAERYRQFSLGRYRALARHADFETRLPAATAIGTHKAGTLIYLIASRQPGIAVENPRQVSAYRYPRQYGPRSPSFARAMYLPWADGAELMVSGTSSVVGHESVHAGAPRRQLDETLNNVESLLQQTAREHVLGNAAGWQPEQLKLYVRDPQLLQTAWNVLTERLGPEVPLLALHGDICRTDLSLEIEALYRYNGAR